MKDDNAEKISLTYFLPHFVRPQINIIFSLRSYMNLNATKCTFGHSDIASRKQQNVEK